MNVELEMKVKKMLSLIQEDGDTFAKRAEMFYKRRPLLIESVEDLHGSYISLAKKYNRLMIRAFPKSDSPISENPNRFQTKLEGSDHDHDHHQKSDLDLEDWLYLESQTEKSNAVPFDNDIGKGWSKLKVNMMKLVQDNLEQQAELVKRNDEKRDTIKELRAQVSNLVAENNELKSNLANSKADIKQKRSQLSKAKDGILKRIMPESRC